MTQSIHQSLIMNVLRQVSTDRLQRAVTALADVSLTMIVTRQTEAEIRALGKNGEGKEYGVALTDCGVQYALHVWSWPYWPETSGKESCPECEAIRKQPALARVP